VEESLLSIIGLMILARQKYIELSHLCDEVEGTIERLRRHK